MKPITLLFLTIPLLLLSACSTPATALPSSKPTSLPATPTIIPATTATASPLATTAPTSSLALDATYTDSFAGYTLRYPSAWHVIDVADNIKPNSYVYTVSIVSYFDPAPSKAGGRPPGSSTVDINVFSFQAKTLDDALTEFQSMIARNEPPETISEQETWLLENGQKATRTWISSGVDRVPALITVINGKTIVITGYGDETIFNAIVHTLK